VKGEAVIYNQFDEFMFPDTLTKFGVFGASKFLNQTGKSYYGDIYTTKPDSKKEISPKKLSMKRTGSIIVKEDADKDKLDHVQTVCMFLPQDKLHLLPFYDLYALRAQTRADKDLMQTARK